MRNHPASASHFHFGNVFANIAVVPATSPDGWDEMGSVTGRVFVAVDFNAEAQSRREIESQSVEYSALVADKAATSWQNYTFSIFHPPFACAPTNRHPYTIAYAYDHKGRMVSKRITENDGHDTLVKSTTYLWDGWNIIREIQWPVASGQWSVETLASSHYPLVTDYVWGLDLDGTLQGAGGVGGLLAVIRSNSNSNSSLYLPTYDANGNVSEYVATNGEIVAHYDYSPFGETLIEAGNLASTFTHRFSTKPWCPVTGLYEYQMRKYRPEIGRWLSRDPIGERGGMNEFLYCENTPLRNVDGIGHKCKLVSGPKIVSGAEWKATKIRFKKINVDYTTSIYGVFSEWQIEGEVKYCCRRFYQSKSTMVTKKVYKKASYMDEGSVTPIYPTDPLVAIMVQNPVSKPTSPIDPSLLKPIENLIGSLLAAELGKVLEDLYSLAKMEDQDLKAIKRAIKASKPSSDSEGEWPTSPCK